MIQLFFSSILQPVLMFSTWLVAISISGCAHSEATGAPTSVETREVTLLFTNDFESAFDPIPAFWDPQVENLGGIAHIATLIDKIRAREDVVFLFDAGDIFTGVLSKKTEGMVPMEMMITMDYDAMAIGNHEFEYGWESFAKTKDRLPFPVLGANLFYAESGLPYAQAFTIVERDGVRIGVIGIMGQDAGTAIIPSNIKGIDIRDPAETIRPYIDMLKPQVDLIVVLTHQGKTAPMQTDDEAHPEIQRGIESEIQLAGAVPGIDVIFSGHADSGTESPYVHPRTGTLIMQTYGQGTRLGSLLLRFERAPGPIGTSTKITSHNGQLIPVVSNELAAHPVVAEKLAAYKAQFPELQETLCFAEERISRRYNEESDLGNLYADIIRAEAGAEIGLMPSGALRADLPAGDVPLIDVIDSFPFTDRVAQLEMTGSQILAVLEQSLTLERGMLQVSGLKVKYTLSKPFGERVQSVAVNGVKLKPASHYHVSTVEIMAQGGDLYHAFREGKRIASEDVKFSDVLTRHLRNAGTVGLPPKGRLLSLD
ncbi:bifunctional metallophosphatase/5'-nucleotidase [Pseudomonadales bacterium]|nr:bifunctional metallophosphatase/5'-nucleotidase [Pseudomonadales bacterium]